MPEDPETTVGRIPGGGENVSLSSKVRTRLYRYIIEKGLVKNQVLRKAITDMLEKEGY